MSEIADHNDVAKTLPDQAQPLAPGEPVSQEPRRRRWVSPVLILLVAAVPFAGTGLILIENLFHVPTSQQPMTEPSGTFLPIEPPHVASPTPGHGPVQSAAAEGNPADTPVARGPASVEVNEDELSETDRLALFEGFEAWQSRSAARPPSPARRSYRLSEAHALLADSGELRSTEPAARGHAALHGQRHGSRLSPSRSADEPRRSTNRYRVVDHNGSADARVSAARPGRAGCKQGGHQGPVGSGCPARPRGNAVQWAARLMASPYLRLSEIEVKRGHSNERFLARGAIRLRFPTDEMRRRFAKRVRELDHPTIIITFYQRRPTDGFYRRRRPLRYSALPASPGRRKRFASDLSQVSAGLRIRVRAG